MARGGYVQPEVAVKKLYAVTGSRKKAKRAIVDALVSGSLETKGKPVSYIEEPTEKTMLRDISSDFGEKIVGCIQIISPNYWQDLDASSAKKWHWDCAIFFNFDKNEPNGGFDEVVLKEKEVNAIAARLKTLP
jgi:hypothetical protein